MAYIGEKPAQFKKEEPTLILQSSLNPELPILQMKD